MIKGKHNPTSPWVMARASRVQQQGQFTLGDPVVGTTPPEGLGGNSAPVRCVGSEGESY